MSTFKFELADRTIVVGTPIEGVWYAGVNRFGNTGAVAKYENGEFTNSSGTINMRFYEFLRRCAKADTPQADVNQPVLNALRWLETLISSPTIPWDPDQRQAAAESLLAAKASL